MRILNHQLRLAILLLLTSFSAFAHLPGEAELRLPTLKAELIKFWGDHPYPATVAAQIEKETCIYLKHPTCWSPHAKLRTSREYGFGFGQFTVAYNADGSERFNTWRGLKATFASELEGWTWENRLDPVLQLRAVVLYDKQIYLQIPDFVVDKIQRLKMGYAAYNGGIYGLLKEIALCEKLPNCDRTRWDKGSDGALAVSSVSMKSRVKYKGYGKSFFEINRDYPYEIFQLRVRKYEPLFQEGWQLNHDTDSSIKPKTNSLGSSTN